MRLYELEEIYRNIQTLVDNEEVSQEEMSLALSQINDEIENKAQNIAWIIKDIEADVEKYKKIEQEFNVKRKSLEKKKESIKQYLENTMINLDKKKFKTDYFSFSIQKNPPSVHIEKEDNIPEEFYKIQKTLDKKSLLEALKNGTEIKYVSIKQGESLRIK